MSGDHPATVEEVTLKKNGPANFACKQLPKTVVGEGGQFVNLKGIYQRMMHCGPQFTVCMFALFALWSVSHATSVNICERFGPSLCDAFVFCGQRSNDAAFCIHGGNTGFGLPAPKLYINGSNVTGTTDRTAKFGAFVIQHTSLNISAWHPGSYQLKAEFKPSGLVKTCCDNFPRDVVVIERVDNRTCSCGSSSRCKALLTGQLQSISHSATSISSLAEALLAALA